MIAEKYIVMKHKTCAHVLTPDFIVLILTELKEGKRMFIFVKHGDLWTEWKSVKGPKDFTDKI